MSEKLPEGFQVIVGSDVNFEDLIAEVMCPNGNYYIISQEKGQGQFDIELDYISADHKQKISLSDFIDSINYSVDRLQKLRRPE